MLISDVARASGVPPKTIRYYEEIGLVGPAVRSENGYRRYGPTEVETLRFVARARSLGFSVTECRDLLALYRDHKRASRDVRRIATAHVDMIERKIEELESLRRTLDHLIERCHGDERPECPILDDLSGH